MKSTQYTITYFYHPYKENTFLCMRRAAHKKLLPNKITGVGGKVNVFAGESSDLDASALREIIEETPFQKNDIQNLRLRFTTISEYEKQVAILYWYTAETKQELTQFESDDGELFYKDWRKFTKKELCPADRDGLPFLAKLEKNDKNVYFGYYTNNEHYTLKINKKEEKN